MPIYTPDSPAGRIHRFFSPTPGDPYGNSAEGPSPASQFAGQVQSAASSAISPERLDDMKALGEAGKQISETMQSIESVASGATQSLKDYRDGVKDVGESVKDFAEKIPVIGEALKAGEAVGGLIGYALFGTKTPEMIEDHIKGIEASVGAIGKAKLGDDKIDDQEKQRLENAKEQKIRQSLSGKELKRHDIVHDRDVRIKKENDQYAHEKMERTTNLATELNENTKRGGTNDEIGNRAKQINARYKKKGEESETTHQETVRTYEETAKIQLDKLDPPQVPSVGNINHANGSNNTPGANFSYSNGSSSSDSALISELKTANQVLLQIKESLGFQ